MEVVKLKEKKPFPFRNPYKDRPPGKLHGIILEEIIFRDFYDCDFVFPSRLADSGQKILQELHKCGIIHGDVKNKSNAPIENLEPDNPNGGEEIVLIDFGCAVMAGELSEEVFGEMAGLELKNWMHEFHEVRLRSSEGGDG